MSLSSIDIKKIKRLSLREVKLPAPKETPVELNTAPQSPSDEEVMYETMISKYPLLEALVASLDLVLIKTEKREEVKSQPIDINKLRKITERVLSRNTSYTKEEVIYRIQQTTKVDRDRVERGFTLMVEAGVIETANQELYCLGGSTPF